MRTILYPYQVAVVRSNQTKRDKWDILTVAKDQGGRMSGALVNVFPYNGILWCIIIPEIALSVELIILGSNCTIFGECMN